MSKLRWYLQLLNQQLGHSGLLGLAVLICGFIYYVAEQVPAEHHLQQLKREVPAAQAAHLRLEKNDAPQLSPKARLDRIIHEFPVEDAVNLTWQNLSVLLDKYGFALNHTVYESSSSQQALLAAYHLNLSVKAAYTQIRSFLSEALNNNANLALENISFKRESADSPVVDASLDFIVYVRGDHVQ